MSERVPFVVILRPCTEWCVSQVGESAPKIDSGGVRADVETWVALNPACFFFSALRSAPEPLYRLCQEGDITGYWSLTCAHRPANAANGKERATNRISFTFAPDWKSGNLEFREVLKNAKGACMRHACPTQIGFALLLIACFCGLPVAQLDAAAVDDVTIAVSNTDKCDGFDGTSFAVYATNTNASKRISGDFQYDTKPGGQSFATLNADLAPVTDQFPKYHEYRLAPGQRARIGCTLTIRASSAPRVPAKISLVTTLRGAVYVDPSQPDPPEEQARPFAAFIVQPGFVNGCGPNAEPDALLFAINLHPYRPINVDVKLKVGDNLYGTAAFPVPALSGTRTACKDGAPSVASVTRVTFTDSKVHAKRSN